MKKFWEWLKHPHGAGLVAVYLISAALIAASICFSIFVPNKGYEFVAYIFYGLAAVALAYSVYSFVVLLPAIKKGLRGWIAKHAFAEKLRAEFGFRTVVFGLFSLLVSVGNALLNGTIGILYASVWYGILAAYYFLLTAIRGGVLLFHRKNGKAAETEDETRRKRREGKAYLWCGVWLVLLPAVLSVVIAETVISDRAFVRAGLAIYASAAYTFYKATTSIINIFKARKTDSLTVQAIRNVNLADALVSLLALQTAMFHEFSPEERFGFANAVTGAVVCALTAALGIFMIVKGSLVIRRRKEEINREG